MNAAPAPSRWQAGTAALRRARDPALALYMSSLVAGMGHWMGQWAAGGGSPSVPVWDWQLMLLWAALVLCVMLRSAWVARRPLRPRWLGLAWRDALVAAHGCIAALGCGLGVVLAVWDWWLGVDGASDWRALGLPLACGAGAVSALLLGAAACALPRASAQAALQGRLPLALRNEVLLLAACASPLLPLAWLAWAGALPPLWELWTPVQWSAHAVSMGTSGCWWAVMGWATHAATRWALWRWQQVRAAAADAQPGRIWLVLPSLAAAQQLPTLDLHKLLRQLGAAGGAVLAPADCGVGTQVGGEHLALALRLGWPERLRPGLPADLADWHRSVPPPGAPPAVLPLWELYPAPSLLLDAARTLPAPQDRVLLVLDDDDSAADALWRGRLDAQRTRALRARDLFEPVAQRNEDDDGTSAFGNFGAGGVIAGYPSLHIAAGGLRWADPAPLDEPDVPTAAPPPAAADTPAPAPSPTTSAVAEPQPGSVADATGVFLSVRRDAELNPAFQRLRSRLAAHGYDVADDTQVAPPQQQVDGCSVAIVIVTPGYQASEQCRQELNQLLQRHDSGQLQHLLPVLGGSMQLQDLTASRLGRYQFLGPHDAAGRLTGLGAPGLTRQSIDAQIDQLVQSLLRVAPPRPAGTPAAATSADLSLHIEIAGDGATRYTVTSSRARSEIAHRMPVQLVQPLLRNLDRAPRAADLKMLHALVALVLPTELVALIRQWDGRMACVNMTLDAAADALPWELLLAVAAHGATAPAPIVPVRVLRRLVDSPDRAAASAQHPAASASDAGAAKPSALVIADPVTTTSLGLPSLPGSRKEAQQLAAFMRRAGLDVDLRVREPALSVTSALLAHDWRVLVLSGHGVADSDGSGTPGMPLGDGQVLGLREVAAMPGRSLEFVFANVEMLGASASSNGRWPQTQPDVSWAAGLQHGGVRAFVLASGQLDDEKAALFGMTVFDQLCNASASLGDAVHKARQELVDNEKDPHALHWAAYRLYGDAGYRLAAGLPAPAAALPPQ